MKRRTGRAAHPGQTIVVFALSSLLLMGGMGLVIDSGYNFVQRRTMQNAADAAALAAARVLTVNSASTAVFTTAAAVAVQNGVATSADVACQYITDANPAGVAACQANTAPPTNVGTITGVRVTVAERHGTFALRALGIASSGTGATAAAQVQLLGGYPGSAIPFVPCGLKTALVGGGTSSILATDTVIVGYDKKHDPIYGEQVRNDAGGYAAIDPAGYAYDWDGSLGLGLPKPGPGVAPAASKPYFKIHDAQVATCGAGSNNFKGLNATTGLITLPAAKAGSAANPAAPITVDNGVKAGPTRSRRVPGVFGCDVDQYDGCVMILPVVDDSGPGGNGNSIVYAGRLWAAFWVKEIDANTHGAYLIANYPISADGTTGWTPSYSGPTVTRLVP